MPTPYRADHVGNLLRPPDLLEARTEFAEGRLPLEGLREVEDACVLRALGGYSPAFRTLSGVTALGRR